MPLGDPLCRYCGEKEARPLYELGLPWGRYYLFCSLIHAAIYGVACALEREPGAPKP